MDELTGDAKRAAVKFGGCVLVAAVIGACVVLGGDVGPYKAFLYTFSGGVCIKLLWPTQDEGQALMDHFKTDE